MLLQVVCIHKFVWNVLYLNTIGQLCFGKSSPVSYWNLMTSIMPILRLLHIAYSITVEEFVLGFFTPKDLRPLFKCTVHMLLYKS
jgi:hypothetical protein